MSFPDEKRLDLRRTQLRPQGGERRAPQQGPPLGKGAPKAFACSQEEALQRALWRLSSKPGRAVSTASNETIPPRRPGEQNICLRVLASPGLKGSGRNLSERPRAKVEGALQSCSEGGGSTRPPKDRASALSWDGALGKDGGPTAAL